MRSRAGWSTAYVDIYSVVTVMHRNCRLNQFTTQNTKDLGFLSNRSYASGISHSALTQMLILRYYSLALLKNTVLSSIFDDSRRRLVQYLEYHPTSWWYVDQTALRLPWMVSYLSQDTKRKNWTSPIGVQPSPVRSSRPFHLSGQT